MQNFQTESNMHTQVPNAHSKYADPAMETMLLDLHETMQENTGLQLFPTYSYYRVYRPGDELKPHKDRESCEISATLCFNYSYENYQWPIYINGNEIILSPGDMAIYKGCELSHWRHSLDHADSESWHVQGFFHYVNSNGPYSHFKNDGRDAIGSNHKTKSKTYKSYIHYVN